MRYRTHAVPTVCPPSVRSVPRGSSSVSTVIFVQLLAVVRISMSFPSTHLGVPAIERLVNGSKLAFHGDEPHHQGRHVSQPCPHLRQPNPAIGEETPSGEGRVGGRIDGPTSTTSCVDARAPGERRADEAGMDCARDVLHMFKGPLEKGGWLRSR